MEICRILSSRPDKNEISKKVATLTLIVVTLFCLYDILSSYLELLISKVACNALLQLDYITYFTTDIKQSWILLVSWQCIFYQDTVVE